MLLTIIKRLNWVDILVIIIMIRICFIAAKRGLVIEIFKILGTLAAVYVSLHYFAGLSDLWQDRAKIGFMPLEFVDFICLVALAVISYLVFVLFREVFARFIKIEAVPRLNIWGGLAVGVFRSFLLAGLLVFSLVISSVDYLKLSVAHSYSGERLSGVAVGCYTNIWNVLMSKFMSQEKFNKTVTEVQEELKK